MPSWALCLSRGAVTTPTPTLVSAAGREPGTARRAGELGRPRLLAVAAGLDARGDRVHRLPQGGELGGGQVVQQVLADAADVHPRHRRDHLEALGGEHQLDPPAVADTGLTLHPAALLEP